MAQSYAYKLPSGQVQFTQDPVLNRDKYKGQSGGAIGAAGGDGDCDGGGGGGGGGGAGLSVIIQNIKFW